MTAPADPVALGRALLARHLLRRGAEALRDAELLLREGRLRGAILRATDAALACGRALVVPRGADCRELAALAAVFDRQLVATDVISRACGLALHRALRARREAEEGDIPVVYAARAEAVRDGARALFAEAEILLERLVGDLPAAPPAGAPEQPEEGE